MGGVYWGEMSKFLAGGELPLSSQQQKPWMGRVKFEKKKKKNERRKWVVPKEIYIK